ncbi:bifunctional (p)ppGpp synthetase II and guanosine-3',5'-bis pyrophosphate 3'-pyrophosphohydrolase [Magnetospirillum gryphiswaldense MSR-1 v2]|uniref:GTP pyrophosphokinase rsh n=1 Tax=Magnetospirillum gryphiswaldense (strain DSM 6361 / JCM 21280 / NBRC 15271 / MSR-1) TaxID=431944 RepID=V6EYS8_MAGGM|nr:bifunctional (p)ppGpp synthetase/guanosine-3',5'-bis(diphosphate) 3'-pyrophosphohydrolase [Magnetospirillum gryphiswaldense]CDK98297.1 bifunctional (p)ppGpp synthetase II and guanosine-3',5'-bis pyrophosphate 3'-pyrophosphohydrolase [Magnetospirillum gryphiswaldense MSR-1 v2]
MMRQFELVERVKSYDPAADEDAINRAYVFAMKMHGSQLRASGDPYFSHPIEVAGILTKYRLDSASIITALLHDTIEDTPATQDDIDRMFGAEIGRLVDGVTKLSRIEMQSDHAKQAENLRKLVLAMSEDIRVLLVKLADRVHNMRTLHFIKNPDKRRRIALETMEIYAPLAERIGMQEMKMELEDLAFTELHGDARGSIIARLNFLREQGGDLIGRILEELRKTLEDAGVQATVSGREKTPYSIWLKMQRKNVGFEQLSDIMAFRVAVGSVEDCYRALGVIHSKYPMVPNRFKDYISTPKPNGYRSLHTGVFGPERHRIEVQIRTHEMHEVSELGVAAHWKYKQGGSRQTDGRQYRWLRELLDILEHASNPEEFLEHTKLEMFQDQVFCFTPKGDLISLPSGATPVDFAYAVHSQVGDTCVGAKINGRIMPLRSRLHNGDQVEIITSKAQTPNPTWERFVVSGKARARIRRFVRTQQRAQYVDLGRAILVRAFRQEGYDLTEKALEGVLKIFKAPSVDDLIADVGEGILTGKDVVLQVYPELKTSPAQHADNIVLLGRVNKAQPKRDKANAVPIKGLIPGMAMHFAGCCHPLPGDRIVGIVSTGKGVTVHTIDCENLEQYAETPERWLDISWEETDGAAHIGRVDLVVANEPGALSTVTTVIAKNVGNITNLKITNRTTEFFEMLIDIEVRDVKHLTNVIAALRATPSISSVERARN